MTTPNWNDVVIAAWNGRAPSWDARSEANSGQPDRAPDIARSAKGMRLQDGSRLLDAGCGSGQFAIAYAALGCHVTGFDISPEMIARARQHASDAGLSIEFQVGDIARLPEPFATYDAIHARVSLHFIETPATALTEFRRVLKPGGRLFVSVPGALSPIYAESWERHLPHDAPRGVNYITPWELEKLLQATGWSILDGWGEYNANASGAENEITPEQAATLPLRLQQAAATSWAFIAR